MKLSQRNLGGSFKNIGSSQRLHTEGEEWNPEPIDLREPVDLDWQEENLRILKARDI